MAMAEASEEVMEIQPDQEANPPGGRFISRCINSSPWASSLDDVARGRPLPDSLATSDSSISFSLTLRRLGGFFFFF